uniref:Uncharacterized protein n=1 Tax=Poecilia latipinna TaxID=48699 RepID=A0A3B3VU05_9TELE
QTRKANASGDWEKAKKTSRRARIMSHGALGLGIGTYILIVIAVAIYLAFKMQPTVYVTQGPLTNPVNDYMGYSIFTMLCCCLPLGIAALIYSIS